MNNLTFTRGITRIWWIPMITGIISIAIGVWCFCSPESSLSVLAYVFAACVIGAGVLNTLFAIINSPHNHEWGLNLLLGLIEGGIGIWLFCLPQNVLITTFIYTVGIYLIFVTITAICATCSLYNTSSDWTGWLLALLLCTLVFAIIFIAGPIGGGIAVWLYIGISFITFGAYRIIFATKLSRINNYIRM